MSTTSQNILESFNQLPEPEKRELAAEIIRWIAELDFPPLTDEDFVLAAEELFIELDRGEAKDAESKSRRGLVS
ncbi:hypothetical protein HYR99_17715 [Candidatus Poribacteria bacterium]|nr:hypothetical protein [Candidatus Poribacteria bacterium]